VVGVNERERRQWLFPDRTGTFDEVDLALLDPAEEGDRRWLIEAEHPELAEALKAELEEVDINGEAMSPDAHVAMHEMVAAQLWADDPPETWATVERLIEGGFERHEILHMVAWTLTAELFRMQKEAVRFDPERYAWALADLPGSWFEAMDEDGVDPHTQELVERAHQVLAQRGPLEADQLAGLLSEEFDLTDDEVTEILNDAPSLVQLAGQRLGLARALLAGAVFTHRVSEVEANQAVLAFTPDLFPLASLVNDRHLLRLSGGGLAELFDAETLEETEFPDGIDQVLGGPEGWLGGTQPGQLVGFRVGPDDVEVVPNVIVPPPPDTLASQLRSDFERCGDGSGIPMTVGELIYQLADSAPRLVQNTVLPPISDLLASSGFEVRAGFAGPSGTDWEAFGRLQTVLEVAAEWDLDPDDARGLMMASEVYHLWLDEGTDFAGAGDQLGQLVAPVDTGEAFIEITASESPEDVLSFIEALKAKGGPRRRNNLGWVEALAAGLAGDHERAEASLRRALAADPDHEGALAEAAWYASDRGDATRAVQLLERLDGEDERLLDVLRRYAVSAKDQPGRNDPCPCGSGKKYKHCHLGASPTHPLPDRVDWLWEKMSWFLRTSEWEHELLDVILALAESSPAVDLRADVGLAQSLLLFQGGAIDDFLRQRGPVLPDDERDLVEQWALTSRSLYEVLGVDQGPGVKLRDVRSGEVVDAKERGPSAQLTPGQLIAVHPVFDGEGYRLLGDIVPVPAEYRDDWINLLEAEAQPEAMAIMIAASRSTP
jgi:tetratricopeptide (TPR) repeat protein